jgi:hypothetical protein
MFDSDVYILASDVMEAIAELKAKLDKAIAERDGNQVCIDSLKQKLESVQASMYCDVVDANMENRRLKRALWLARAQAADGFATISRWTDYEDMHPDTKIGYRKWYKKFMHVKALCKAKAEEYK